MQGICSHFFWEVDEETIKESRTRCDITRRIGKIIALICCARRSLKVTLLTVICQHCGVKTGTVTPSFYYVFNISLSCNINKPSFIENLWWDLLLGNHLK